MSLYRYLVTVEAETDDRADSIMASLIDPAETEGVDWDFHSKELTDAVESRPGL